MRTKPPCYIDGKDCAKRYVGCRGACEEWQKWLVIHEAETERNRRNKSEGHDADNFLIEKSQRSKRAYIRECVVRHRREK